MERMMKMKRSNKKIWLTGLVLVLLCLFAIQAHAQVFPGNYDPTFLLPISYFYTNPLYYTDYGYINSLTDPFYNLGYGYFPPIPGNLLGSYRVNPFLNSYEDYLYRFTGYATYPFFGSPYTTTFPFNTLPGTPIPYTRFSYPSYVYGSPDFYLSWTMLQ
jgi:hypothetical protein